MKGLKGYMILARIVFSSVIGYSPVFGGSFDQQIYNENFERIRVENRQKIAHVLEPVVKLACPAPNSDRICIDWRIILPASAGAEAQALRSSAEGALNQWGNLTSTRLKFPPVTTDSSNDWPYRPILDASGQPTGSFEVDSRGRRILSGPFLISFNPPTDLSFETDEIYKVIHYFNPNEQSGEAEVLWAGIFLNPGLVPNQDYSVVRVLLHAVGETLGLAKSTVPGSVMHPEFIEGTGSTQLSSDDQLWIANRYPSTNLLNNRGQMSGLVFNGNEGDAKKPVVGARIDLIPKSRATDFARTFNRALVAASTVSDVEGLWKIVGLPAGEYIAFLSQLPSNQYVSDAIEVYKSEVNFAPEFYDGRRESNLELASNYSPRMLDLAATLFAENGKMTDPVWLITNTLNSNARELRAPGSNRETTVNFSVSRNIDQSLQDQQSQSEASGSSSGGGGCSVQGQEKATNALLAVLMAIFSVCLGLRKVFQANRSRFDRI